MELLKKLARVVGFFVLVACGSSHHDNKPQTGSENPAQEDTSKKPGDHVATPTVDRKENPPTDNHGSEPAGNRDPASVPGANPTTPGTNPVADTSAKIVGNYVTADGKSGAFEQFTQKPLVVFISAFGCSSCSEETQNLKKYLTSKLGRQVPSNVDFVTLLLSSSKEDAADWRDMEKIPWEVGFQPDDNLIRKYCTKMITPCTLVRIPYKGIVLAKNGIIPPEQLESLTGAWQ